MAPKQKITKEMILNGAVQLTEQYGADYLSAKTLAKQLNCSTQPLFWYYDSLGDIKREVEEYAEQLFAHYLRQNIADMSAYKAIGINYVRFAKEHKQLFRLLLMSNKVGQDILNSNPNLPFILETLQKEHSLTDAVAGEIVRQMWFFSHGIATMFATGTAEIPEEEVSRMISSIFRGLLLYYSDENK